MKKDKTKKITKKKRLNFFSLLGLSILYSNRIPLLLCNDVILNHLQQF